MSKFGVLLNSLNVLYFVSSFSFKKRKKKRKNSQVENVVQVEIINNCIHSEPLRRVLNGGAALRSHTPLREWNFLRKRGFTPRARRRKK